MTLSRRHFLASTSTSALSAAVGSGLGGGLALSASKAWAEGQASEVRIGFQKGAPILLLARKQQVIENRLKPLGVTVKWVEFQFGPPMLEAIGAGAVDVGAVGDVPPIFAQSAGANLLYVAGAPSVPHAVLVPKNSPIKTVADLKGKRIAVAKGSSAQNVAIKALAHAGLSITKDVTPIYLGPADATSAFIGGNVDAWIVWDPYYAIAEDRYNARSIADTSDSHLSSSGYYLANKDFANQQSKLLVSTLEELSKLTTWAGSHRGVLADLAAEATGIDAKIWKTSFDRQAFGFGPITPFQIHQQQELADAFLALNLIPKKINVSDSVWTWPTK